MPFECHPGEKGAFMAPCGCHLGGATVAPDILGAMWHLRGCRFLDNEMALFLVPLGTTCRNGDIYAYAIYNNFFLYSLFHIKLYFTISGSKKTTVHDQKMKKE